MDDFIPPKPPEGLGDNSKKVVNDYSSKTKKKNSMLGRLFKSKKKNDLKDFEASLGKESEDVLTDDLFSSKIDELKIESDKLDDDLLSDSLLSDDFLSDELDFDQDVKASNKNVKSSKSKKPDSKKSSSIESSKKIKDSDEFSEDLGVDDLNNIKAALGIYEKSGKSIRSEFEDNPESFSKKDKKTTSNDWLDSVEHGDLDIGTPSFAAEPKKPKSKSSKKESDLVAKSFNDEFNSEFNTLIKKSVEVEKPVKKSTKKVTTKAVKKAPAKKTNVVSSKKVITKKSAKKVVKKALPKDAKKPLKKELSKKHVKKSAKVTEAPKAITKSKKVTSKKKPNKVSKEDLPSFSNVVVAKKKVSKNQFVKKVESGLNVQSRLSEQKIEKLISESASKKKNSILDKTREKILLTSFERQVKKIIASNIKALEKEEKKVVDLIDKKSNVIDKKLESLDKKKDVVDKREESAKLNIDKLKQESDKLDVELKNKNVALDKVELNLSKEQDNLLKLDGQKTIIRAQIANLKESLKSAKERNNKTMSNLEAESALAKKSFNSDETKLKKQFADLEKKLIDSKKELEDVKAKVSESLSKLSAKEKTVDKKSRDLNRLVDEERKVLELLRNSSGDSSYSSSAYAADDSVDSSDLNFDYFSSNIDNCESLVNVGSVDEAKASYNELRDNFLSADLSSSEKTKIKFKLKALFNLIDNS